MGGDGCTSWCMADWWDALFGVMLSRRDSIPDQGPKGMVPLHEVRKAGGMQSLGLGSLDGIVDLIRGRSGWYHLMRSVRPVGCIV